ncbi:hypothetical protein FCN77_20570 [Arthrobacter sp. 24S4-2]|uniref:hypothetical protein n=1 Tax=Arthrobacter sp. 24S4-2 TaxID=2575374 RepID=UPI0010C7B0FE|nr:hypothetical protein [Arthrobacter sp. 24S4-2]QCO99659.1 hypothetical protein FCN77_20570 [Arthrobacter sp. 24S4-2]
MSGGGAQGGWESLHFEELLNAGDLLCIDVLGTQFAVRWGRAVTAEQGQSMRSAWARCASSGAPVIPPLPKVPTVALPFSASVAYQSHGYDGGTFPLQAASFQELAESLASRLTGAALAENAGELMMLHACGVAAPETGAVVALVAQSPTGRTAAASVLARTFGYITDSIVAIQPDGSVVPYPGPLSLDKGTGAPERQVGPDQLGLRPAPPRPFLRSIVLLDRVDAAQPSDLGHGRPGPILRQMPMADALVALVPDSPSQAEMDQPLQSLCRLIDFVGGVWQVTYSEAEDLPRVLEPLFRKRRRTRPGWAAAPLDAESGAIPDGWLRGVEPRDAVIVDGDLLLMLDAEIVRINGIAPAAS